MPFSLTVTVEYLRDVLGLHRRVEDALRLDDDEGAPLAEAVAARAFHLHVYVELEPLNLRPEGLDHLFGPAGPAARARADPDPRPFRVQVGEELFSQLIERLNRFDPHGVTYSFSLAYFLSSSPTFLTVMLP